MTLEEALAGLDAQEKEFLLQSYDEPFRKYHTRKHLENMFRWITDPVGNEADMSVLVDSILFHDIAYTPAGVSVGLNEALSAMAFLMSTSPEKRDVSNWQALIEYNTAVVHCINASAYHHLDQVFLSGLCQFFLDLDLQSFAQEREEFLVDSESVAAEFIPFVGEEIFFRGNMEFMRMLLKRKKLYYVKTEWEEPARKNLQWRIDEIAKKLGE